MRIVALFVVFLKISEIFFSGTFGTCQAVQSFCPPVGYLYLVGQEGRSGAWRKCMNNLLSSSRPFSTGVGILNALMTLIR